MPMLAFRGQLESYMDACVDTGYPPNTPTWLVSTAGNNCYTLIRFYETQKVAQMR